MKAILCNEKILSERLPEDNEVLQVEYNGIIIGEALVLNVYGSDILVRDRHVGVLVTLDVEWDSISTSPISYQWGRFKQCITC